MNRARDNLLSPIGLVLFVGMTTIGLVVDLVSKAIAVDRLAPNRTYRFIPNYLHFTYVENFGAVFGQGQGYRWLFVAVSIGAIAFLVYLYAQSNGRRFYQFLLGMLLAGVLGNMYDRVRFGYVRDMIHALPGVYWPDAVAKHLPDTMAGGGVFPWVFNIADSFLCVGIFLMIVYSMFARVDENVEADPQLNGVRS